MSRKNKILFLLHIPPPVHGSSIVGETIFSSKSINSTFECSYVNLLVSRTVSETGKKNPLKFIRFIFIWFRLLKTLLNKKIDFAYFALTTTGEGFYKDVMLIVLLKIFNVKRVYHLHNKGIKLSTSNINKVLYKFIFKNADVILLSELLYSDISDFVNKSNTYLCPNGIEEAELISSTPHINNPPVILFLSNLIQSKGLYNLLESLQIINEKNIHFNCLIVGGEGDISTATLNEKIEYLNLSDKIQYLGKKYDIDKINILDQSDIFALPTYYSNECFPLVLLEAMQFSLPVISTYEGGIPDIVDDGVTGFLVQQRDTKALADKLEILIKDAELRKRMGEAGRKKYEQQFTLEIFENRLVEILNQVLEK